jgi:hypothetical protein
MRLARRRIHGPAFGGATDYNSGMPPQWTPMRWPAAWSDPSSLRFIEGTAINHILVDPSPQLDPIRAAAQQKGIHCSTPDALPPGVVLAKGAWPGIKMASEAGGGPTGVPWVDSNGWLIRLTSALKPESTIWVDAPPKDDRHVRVSAYRAAIADGAAHGGRWVIALDKAWASGIAAPNSDAVANWKKLAQTAAFFDAHKAWADYAPVAVAALVSDFTGPNEFFSQELLNLLARAGLHYRIVPKDRVTAASLAGLRAVIYADQQPPAPNLRAGIDRFVEAGGMLITAPKWGAVSGAPVRSADQPRFVSHVKGKGTISIAKAEPDDPYLFANDAVVLVSHRYDQVRFWNGGATAAYYTLAPGGKQAVVHCLFYADWGPDSASVRIAGRFRSVRMSTLEQPDPRPVPSEADKDGIEVHLPQVSQYVALQLEV